MVYGCMDLDTEMEETSIPQSQNVLPFLVASFTGMIPFYLRWHKQPKETPGLQFYQRNKLKERKNQNSWDGI